MNGRKDFCDCIVIYTTLLGKKKEFLCKCDLTILFSHVKIFRKFFGGRGVVSVLIPLIGHRKAKLGSAVPPSAVSRSAVRFRCTH